MKVLIVANNAYYRGNGLCTAIQTLHRQLTAAGVESRIMCSYNPEPGGGQPYYPLPHFKFPFFEKIIYSSGFRYAGADRAMMKEAIEWADVVHLEDGFPINAIAANIARRLGKPCVSTYHLFAENILANLGMTNAGLISGTINLFWRKLVFDKCLYVHCPTEKVREILEHHHYKSELRVISNGIFLPPADQVLETPQMSPYAILCIGRLSNEKSQGTLINAMRYSRHASEIQLIFAGKGPKAKKYKRMTDKLMQDGVVKYEPTFGFYDTENLAALSRKAFLYIHNANVEVEGLSCLEALSYGAVPVIAEGKFTATSHFALDDRSKFPVGNSKALAERIDWWIEHPEERIAMGKAYADAAREYDIDHCTAEIIKMYEDAIRK